MLYEVNQLLSNPELEGQIVSAHGQLYVVIDNWSCLVENEEGFENRRRIQICDGGRIGDQLSKQISCYVGGVVCYIAEVWITGRLRSCTLTDVTACKVSAEDKVFDIDFSCRI